jgi:photosystem II stability/assembly factor-like uncharacterized protein
MAPPPTLPAPAGELQNRYAFCDPNSYGTYAGEFFSIDPLIGWAFCAGAGQAHYLGTQLYQTRDGGQHWEKISSDPPYGSRGPTSLFFLDAQRGWISCDSGVFATQDGGKTWQPLLTQTSADPLAVQFSNAEGIDMLSPQVGYAIFHQTNLNSGQDALVKTRDGGTTWQPVYSAPAAALWPRQLFQMITDGQGIGVGDAGLMATADAGQTWSALPGKVQAKGCDLAVQVSGLSFPDPQHGWATLKCGLSPWPGIATTTDGGRTWREQTGIGSSSGDGFVGVSFPDRQTGYLVSQAGYLYHTSNGGATFALADPHSVHTASLQFAAPDLGWELRGTSLFETQDGGKTWQAVPFPLPVQFFSLLPDGSVWLAAGELQPADGSQPVLRLFSTQDRGRTWAEHAFEGGLTASGFSGRDAIQFVDPQHGWLRANDAFFFTPDGGRSWAQLH